QRTFLRGASLSAAWAKRLRAARYDLVIKGGRVIDPAGHVDRVADVAIRGDRISAVRADIAAADAAAVLDARGKLVVPGLIDVDAARRAIAQHREWIAGVKVRLSETACGKQDLEALGRARQAAGPLPVMLHVGQTFSPLPRILELLSPGDIVTHPYSPPPHTILDDNGHVLREVREARRRGIRFDVGNGRTAHITWPIVEAATRD